jgi:sec-independent protein translocase protein TatB
MFHNLGWSELIVLVLIGLVIFGPDRLPKAASDAAKMLRQLRSMSRNATADLKAELGPEMADLDLASLHPRRIVASVFEDEDEAIAATVPARPTPLAPGEKPPYDHEAT